MEQISTLILDLVEPTSISLPHAQRMVVLVYSGWMSFFMILSTPLKKILKNKSDVLYIGFISFSNLSIDMTASKNRDNKFRRTYTALHNLCQYGNIKCAASFRLFDSALSAEPICAPFENIGAFGRLNSKRITYAFMDFRKPLLSLVPFILSSKNSILSTVLSVVKSLRKIQTRFNVSSFSSNSSLRVPERLISIAG